MRSLRILAALFILWPPAAFCDSGSMNLKTVVQMAIDANLSIQSSREERLAAEAAKNAQKTRFFPTFNTKYEMYQYDEGQPISAFVRTPETVFEWSASVTQPIYSGRALQNQYDMAKLGVNVAELMETITRRAVILQSKRAYFKVLGAKKLLDISEQTVRLIQAQADVADQYYQVGMTPLNDKLQSQVALANAIQDQMVAANTLEIANAELNTLLRRSMDTEVNLVDITGYAPWAKRVEDCLAAAEKQRLEIELADRQVELAQKEVDLARSVGLPSVNFSGSYYRNGDDPWINGGDGITDPDGWVLAMVASWNFWQWKRPQYNVEEKSRRLAQKENEKKDLLDQIRLEVKQAYLKTKESEKNITTVEKAIEQAEENVRINQERYREQVSTSTDVLNAQTLLVRTMTNYYRALYSFHTNKAALYHAMGREEVE